MSQKKFLFTLIAATLFVSLLVNKQHTVIATTANVGASVTDTLQSEERVFVVVALNEPAATRSTPVNIAALQAQVATLQTDVLETVSAEQFTVTHQFSAVPALSGWISAEGVQKLANHPSVRRIDLDEGGTGSLADTIPMLNIDDWHAQSVTGEGVTVAVLDSGYDSDHPDLSDDLTGEACFLNFDGFFDGVGRCPNGSERQMGAGSAEDDHFHGTFVSGIITSNGTQSSVGVAPDADIVAIKVLDANNSFWTFSEITSALDYIITNHPEVDIINASLGTFARFSGPCDNAASWIMAGASAVNTLRSRGTIMFVSSGNDGASADMQVPACIANVVSVGATDKSDNVAGYSNSDSTLDIYAPGSSITSSNAGGGTRTGNGTSYASPHAAGCAALLIESGVATTPDAIEAYLKGSSVVVTDTTNSLSAPRIDCYRTVPTAVSLSNSTTTATSSMLLFTAGIVVLLTTSYMLLRRKPM